MNSIEDFEQCPSFIRQGRITNIDHEFARASAVEWKAMISHLQYNFSKKTCRQVCAKHYSDKNSFNFNKSQPLLIPGKTLNPAVALFHQLKVPLTVIGGVSSVFYAFGVKNTFIFLGQSIVGLVTIFCVGALVFYQMRKKKMDLYPEILKVFVDNRSKIENFIGTFEVPPKSELQWESKKTKEEGKQREVTEFVIRIIGSRGYGTASIRAIEVEQQKSDFKRFSSFLIENFTLELHGIGAGKEFTKFELVKKDIPPIKTFKGVILEEQTFE